MFAFRVAQEETGNKKAFYSGNAIRKVLVEDPAFAIGFVDPKARNREMDPRYAEEADPLRQAMLELYVSIVLSTPHNDFDTH